MSLDSWNKKGVCFWSWNGIMEVPELLEQLKQFSDNHLGGVIIHSRAGLKIPYMGDQWFAALEAVLEESKKLDMEVFLYDEDGWPSGFASGKVPKIKEEFCFKRLQYGNGRSLAGNNKLIAAYHCVNDRLYTRVKLDAAAEDDLFFWFTADSHYTDILNPEAVQRFIGLTHEVYKKRVGQYFGSVIKGIFTDEPQLNCAGYSWSFCMPQWYNEEYGEDLLDDLWLLAVEGQGYQAVRRNWWQLINKRFEASYVSPISQWCRHNGIAMTGHYACEDSLSDQIASCGGVMPHYEHMQLPGIDHLGNRVTSPVLLKQVASVSNQLNNGEVLSETYGCAGWGVSFSRLAWIWGRQSVMGITKPCFHLSAYTMEGCRKRDYPAFFSYQELWWKDFSYFSDWLNEHNRLMMEGKRLCDTLVISPLIEAMGIYEPQNKSRTAIGYVSTQYRLLLEHLLNLQVDFEIGDEKLMASHASVENGMLRLGSCAYSRVFVPPIDTLLATTWGLLEEFIRQGGQVIYTNKLPAGIPAAMAEKEPPIIQIREELFDKFLQFSGYQRKVCLREPAYMNMAKDLLIHVRQIEQGLRIHIWNASWEKQQKTVLCVKGRVGVRLLTLTNHTFNWLPSIYDGKDETQVALTVEAGANVVVEAIPETNIHYAHTACISEKWVFNPEAALTSKNCLTIDYASYAFNGDSWSEEMPVIQLLDLLYRKIPASGMVPVKIRYRFYCEGLEHETANLSLAAEDRAIADIFVNEKSVKKMRTNWWMDKAIGEYEIKRFVKNGSNEVVILYELSNRNNGINIHEVFETERNRFFYPIEPENIYIRGNFDVVVQGDIFDHSCFYSVTGSKFVLAPLTKKHFGDLTAQGLWFYRGDAEYSFDVAQPADGNRLLLSIRQNGGSLIQWQVNKGSGYILQAPFEVDITDWLQPGDNKICIRLVGTNRNALGPHHHIQGENIFVGPSTFKGRLGFEDFVSPAVVDPVTWTNDYAFIPFGIEEIKLKEQKVIRGGSDEI